MVARFDALPRNSTVKWNVCALQYASEDLNCQAAWLSASVRFRGAQPSSGVAARFSPLPRTSTVKRNGCAL
eukprot:15663071-Heterocapsa_arctica.AAC.1